MTSNPRIGFVGFGEAGFHIAGGLRGAGIETSPLSTSIQTPPGLGEKIRHRAAKQALSLAASNAELAAASDIILSTVTANQALAAAEQTVPLLTGSQLYADLNSVSPVLKQAIDRVITATGAKFVEVAVMAPAPPMATKYLCSSAAPARPNLSNACSRSACSWSSPP